MKEFEKLETEYNKKENSFKKIKEDYEKKYNEELNKTGIFWAFSDGQFEENRTHKEAPIKEYLSVGAGGYIHQSDKEKLDNFFKVIAKELKKDFTSKIKIEDLIKYELTNYECYYTGDPTEAIEVVKTYYEDISDEEIESKVLEIFTGGKKLIEVFKGGLQSENATFELGTKKFYLGHTVQTRSIKEACKDNEEFTNEIFKALNKYMTCDWGDTCKEDAELNDNAVENNNDRVVAKYKTSKGNIFIITEYDRSQTTILFASEY